MPAPVDFLGLLDDRERTDLEAIATPRRAHRGQAILSEGQVPDRVILLQRGFVKVVAAGADGQEVVLAFRLPPALLGEQALMQGAPLWAGVWALKPVDMYTVAASRFRHYLDE